jgi:hypothetical protein
LPLRAAPHTWLLALLWRYAMGVLYGLPPYLAPCAWARCGLAGGMYGLWWGCRAAPARILRLVSLWLLRIGDALGL